MIERHLGSKSVAIGLNMGRDQDAFGIPDEVFKLREFLIVGKGFSLRFLLTQLSPQDPHGIGRKPFMTALAQNDLLYTIFEQHLFNFQDPNSDRGTFILAIVKDYLTQIRKLGLSVPGELEEAIFEELSFQVNTMLVKKIYGCMTIDEYIAKTPTPERKSRQKKANAKYRELTSKVNRRDLKSERPQKKAA